MGHGTVFKTVEYSLKWDTHLSGTKSEFRLCSIVFEMENMFLARRRRKYISKKSLINKWNTHFKTVENSLKWDTHLSGTKSEF